MEELTELAAHFRVLARSVAFTAQEEDDAYQDVWIGALKAARSFDPSRGLSFETWCAYRGYWYARQRHSRQYRSERRTGVQVRTMAAWRALDDGGFELTPLWDLVPQDGFEDHATNRLDLLALLHKAEGRLDQRQLQIVVRAAFGETQHEIAQELGISQMHVSRLRRQALASLAALRV